MVNCFPNGDDMAYAEELQRMSKEEIGIRTGHAYHCGCDDRVAPDEFACDEPFAEQNCCDREDEADHGNPCYQIDNGSLMC